VSPLDARRGPGQGLAPIDTAAKQFDAEEGTAQVEQQDDLRALREVVGFSPDYSSSLILSICRDQSIFGDLADDRLTQLIDKARRGLLDDLTFWSIFNPVPDLDAFLATPLPAHIARDVIPGVMKVGHRVIITGQEGVGKSTFLTQIGLQVAAGVHPFTGEAIEPQQVFDIDGENPLATKRDRLTALRAVAGDRFNPDRYRVKVTDRQPLDLTNRATFAEVESWVDYVKPDLIILGPLYKFTNAGLDDEESAKALASALDGLAKSAALIIEAHVGHEGPRGRRPIRPIGSSLWLRWPEFGLHLAKGGALTPWREHRVPAAWPTRLERGEPWPWMPAGVDGAPLEREGVSECVAAIERLLAADPGEEFSKTRVVDALRSAGVNAGHRTVSEALDTLRQNGTVVHRKGPRRADLYRLAEGS
jgi:hypothetical protein